MWFWVAAIAVAAAAVWIAAALSGMPGALEDFEVYRRAAWDVRQGASVYVTHLDQLTYEYFPWLAVAMVPFTWIDERTGGAIWTMGVCGAIVAAVWLSARLADTREMTPRHWMLVAAFVPLAWAELLEGQVNAMMMAAALAGALALRRGRGTQAAAWFVAAALIKPNALIFLPWLCLVHRRVGVAVVATLAVLLAVAGAVLPGATVIDWSRRVWIDSLERVTEPPNVSIGMWATRLTDGHAAAAVLAAVLLALLGVVIACFVLRRPAGATAGDAADIALLCVAMPLISPQAWFGQFLLAIPAAVLIAERWPHLRPRDRAIFATTMLLMCGSATILEITGSQFVIDNVSLAMTLAAPGTIWVLTVTRAEGKGQRAEAR